MFTRIREKHLSEAGRFHYLYHSGSTVYDSVVGFGLPLNDGSISITRADTIIDSPHKFSKTGHYPDSAVTHGVWTRLSQSSPLFSFIHLNGALIELIDYTVPYDANLWFGPIVPSIPADALSNLCWPPFIQWSQQIPSSGTNIGNFVLELQEWEQLIPKLEGSLAGVVENGFLSFEFGSSPFISDLQNLSSLVQTVQSRIKYLKATYGKKVRLSHFVPNAYTPSIGSSILNFTSPGITRDLLPLHFELRIRDYRSDLRVGGYQVQQLIGLDDNESIFRAFYTALGLNNVAKTVWNAIPFSFVVDWFAKIGTQLDSLSTQPFDGPWSIVNINWSFSQTVYVDCYLVCTTPGHYNEQLVNTYRFDGYTRDSGLPARLVDLTDDLSPTQLALLFSLVHRGSVG